MNATFVSAVCDHRETKAALLHKVKVLQGDLHTAKQTCKDQEYHMQKKEHEYQTEKTVTTTAEKAVEKSGGVEKEREKECAAWEQEKAGWTAEKTEQARENEGLRKRVHELEVVELGWKQVHGIFTTEWRGEVEVLWKFGSLDGFGLIQRTQRIKRKNRENTCHDVSGRASRPGSVCVSWGISE